MKKLFALLVVACCLWPFSVMAGDKEDKDLLSLLSKAGMNTANGIIVNGQISAEQMTDLISQVKNHSNGNRDTKISTITGIIPICDDQDCEPDVWDTYINDYPKLRFLDRRHIKAVIDEHKLNLSGLTEVEQSIKAGKFVNASHLLLYRKETTKFTTTYQIKLLNINSLEIEFTSTLVKYIYADDPITFGAYAMGMGSYGILNTLNRHAQNSDGKTIYVVKDDYQALKIDQKNGIYNPILSFGKQRPATLTPVK
jgi:hypothetical protein